MVKEACKEVAKDASKEAAKEAKVVVDKEVKVTADKEDKEDKEVVEAKMINKIKWILQRIDQSEKHIKNL